MTPMAKFLPHDVVLHGKMGFLFLIKEHDVDNHMKTN